MVAQKGEFVNGWVVFSVYSTTRERAMTNTDNSLRDRILTFDIDGGPAAYTFIDKLMKEQGWSRAYAEGAVREYKRFLVLGTMGRGVTPSEVVDTVWHQHLTYTVSYWDRLCGEVLGRPFHHHPTRGGSEEDDKHARWYRETRRRYEETFGESPPTAYWPDPDATTRFALGKEKSLWLGAAALVATVGVAFGLRDALGTNPAAGTVHMANVGMVIFIVIVVGVVTYAIKKGGGGKGGQCNGRGCGSFWGCGNSCGSSCGSSCGGGCGGN
jgi:hypothetical protein